jgi:hypothetical protein
VTVGGSAAGLAAGDDVDFAVGIGHDAAWVFVTSNQVTGLEDIVMEFGRVVRVAKKRANGAGAPLSYCRPVHLDAPDDNNRDIVFYGQFYAAIPAREVASLDIADDVKQTGADGRLFRYMPDSHEWMDTPCEYGHGSATRLALAVMFRLRLVYPVPYESVAMRVRMRLVGGTREDPVYQLHAEDSVDCDNILQEKHAEQALAALPRASIAKRARAEDGKDEDHVALARVPRAPGKRAATKFI